jgi:hypothetical protein
MNFLLSLLFTTAIAAQCPPTELVGFENGMTEDDKANIKNFKKRCGEIYPDSPCLKRVTKRGELNYWVVCGAANEQKKRR